MTELEKEIGIPQGSVLANVNKATKRSCDKAGHGIDDKKAKKKRSKHGHQDFEVVVNGTPALAPVASYKRKETEVTSMMKPKGSEEMDMDG